METTLPAMSVLKNSPHPAAEASNAASGAFAQHLANGPDGPNGPVDVGGPTAPALPQPNGTATSGPDGPGGVVALFRQLEAFPQRVQTAAMEHRQSLAALPPNSPQRTELEAAYSTELLAMQTEAHSLHFRTELVSKFVEHTTSGMKTVLQTQA